MSPSAATSAARSSALARLRLAMALSLVLPLSMLFGLAAYFYWQEFAKARQDLSAAARIVQEHAQKMLETNEAMLERMLDLFGTARDAELLARGAELHERMKAMTRDFPQVQGYFSIGADGRMLATNRTFPPPREIDFSDREFVAAHRSGTGARVFITGNLVSRVTGESFFDMSRRRTLPDGTYGGTVNIALYPEYLTRFWGELTSTMRGLRATLLRADGVLIARFPGGVPEGAVIPAAHPLMQQIRAGATEGSFEGISPFDSTGRLGSFRKVGDYPVYVATGFHRAQPLRNWLWRTAWLVLLVVPFAAALAWMGWLALKRTRDELDAAAQLKEETLRRTRAEDALLQAQKLEALGRLTGGVAHDFNNLLAVVANNAQLLKLSPRPEESAAAVEAIGRAVQSGSKLTGQLLSFARRQPMRPEPTALQDQIDTWSTLIRPILTSRIELETRVEPGVPAVLADRAGLELAILNLAVNAADAMPDGGTLRIAIRKATGEEDRELAGQFSVVEVVDNGSGMTPEVLARIFDPFFTTKPPGKGTGLGLSQVYGFCEQAGGTVRAVSVPGEGTTMRIYLRADLSARANSQERAAVATRLPASVLLVDDNVEVAEAIGAILRRSGCEIHHAASVDVALSILGARASDFDLVLSDIVMPGSSGVELARAVRARWPAMIVVLMTGYPLGAEEPPSGVPVLRKPFDLSDLAAAIAA